MKTITEFTVTTLKNALKTKQELTTAGKTAEELPAAMGEALKLEGDKLTILMSALEAIEKKTNDLKRVVVLTLAEGEKAPKGAEQKGDHYFCIEFFPPMPGQERKGRGRDGGRGGRDDKGRGDKRGGKRGGGRDGKGRGPGRGDRPGGEGMRAAGGPGGAPSEGGKPGGDQRRRRPPRGPRPGGAGPSRGPIPVQRVGEPAQPAAPRAPIKPLTPIQPKTATPLKAPAKVRLRRADKNSFWRLGQRYRYRFTFSNGFSTDTDRDMVTQTSFRLEPLFHELQYGLLERRRDKQVAIRVRIALAVDQHRMSRIRHRREFS